MHAALHALSNYCHGVVISTYIRSFLPYLGVKPYANHIPCSLLLIMICSNDTLSREHDDIFFSVFIAEIKTGHANASPVKGTVQGLVVSNGLIHLKSCLC